MIMVMMRIVVHDNKQERVEDKANNMHNENEQDIKYARVTVHTAIIDTTNTNKRDSKPGERKRQTTRKSTESKE